MEFEFKSKFSFFLGIGAISFFILWLIFIFGSIYSYYLYLKISSVDYKDIAKYEILDSKSGLIGIILRDDNRLDLLLADSYAAKYFLSIEDMKSRNENKIKEQFLSIKKNHSGKLKSQTKDFLQAVKYYQNAIISNPLSGESHLKLGILYAGLKMNYKASKEFEKATLLDPTNAYHLFDLGRYFLSIGEYKKGFENLKRANSLRAQSLQISLDLVWEIRQNYQDLIQITPQGSSDYLTLGEFLLRKGLWNEAVGVYKKAISKYPENTILYKYLSQAYQKSNMREEAIELLKVGIKKNPENPDLYSYIGIIYSQINAFDDAIYNIGKAIKLFKDKSDTKPLIEYHLNLGEIYYNKIKDFEKALQESELVLKLNPVEARGYFLKGLCYQSMDSDPVAMINSFKKAVYYNPNELQYRIILAENFYTYTLYKEALLEWEGIKKFKPYEKIAEEKIKVINNALKEEQKNFLNKRN